MSRGENANRTYTSLSVTQEMHTRLENLKPYDSMSYNDLLAEMATSYEESEQK